MDEWCDIIPRSSSYAASYIISFFEMFPMQLLRADANKSIPKQILPMPCLLPLVFPFQFISKFLVERGRRRLFRRFLRSPRGLQRGGLPGGHGGHRARQFFGVYVVSRSSFPPRGLPVGTELLPELSLLPHSSLTNSSLPPPAYSSRTNSSPHRPHHFVRSHT